MTVFGRWSSTASATSSTVSATSFFVSATFSIVSATSSAAFPTQVTTFVIPDSKDAGGGSIPGFQEFVNKTNW